MIGCISTVNLCYLENAALDAEKSLCYSLANCRGKIGEQREYRKMRHHREPALVGDGMGRFREWVCEMQAERRQVG